MKQLINAIDANMEKRAKDFNLNGELNVQRAKVDDFIQIGRLRADYEKIKLDGEHRLRNDETDERVRMAQIESDERVNMRKLELEHEFKMAELLVREKEIESNVIVKRYDLINERAEQEAKLISERVDAEVKARMASRSEFTKALMSSAVQFAVPVIGVYGTKHLWEEFVPVLLEFETNNSVNSFVSKQLLTFPKLFGRK